MFQGAREWNIIVGRMEIEVVWMAGTQAQHSLGAAWELELDPAGPGSSPVKGRLASESPRRRLGLKETTKTLFFFLGSTPGDSNSVCVGLGPRNIYFLKSFQGSNSRWCTEHSLLPPFTLPPQYSWNYSRERPRGITHKGQENREIAIG